MSKSRDLFLGVLVLLLGHLTIAWAQNPLQVINTTSQTPKGCAQLQTDKKIYKPGEPVTIFFTNNCAEPVTLDQPFPWWVTSQSGEQGIARAPYLQITRVQSGQQLQDIWNQLDSRGRPAVEGTWILWLDTLDAGRYTTSFEIRGSRAAALKDFDASGNGVIDDDELFMAIDQWVAGQIRDELFFALIDAWVSQTPIQETKASSSKIVALSIHASKTSLAFIATGSDVTRLTVAVFDLDGRLVFSQRASGTRLIWNLKTQSGKPLAHGIYLAAVIVHGPDGRITRELRKLAVLR